VTRSIIIGAGDGGTRAVLDLRDAGAGPAALIGAEPHQPDERPALSKPKGAKAQAERIKIERARLPLQRGAA
jgi:3-phenylpropionate/trans-cinnamate dioxygenase ferredoxin reductase component